MLENLREDTKRYFVRRESGMPLTMPRLCCKFIRTPALWVIALHRYRRWIKKRFSGSALGFLLKIPYGLFNPPLALMFGIHLDSEADIGRGLYIGHHGSIWIGPIRMGDYCNISQEVTIGLGGRGDDHGRLPSLGSRVYVAPGAKIFGGISIGDDVAIGANAVVSKSLPDKAVAVGNPARIVSRDGSTGLIFV
jgi:serine O-acetyltransferase